MRKYLNLSIIFLIFKTGLMIQARDSWSNFTDSEESYNKCLFEYDVRSDVWTGKKFRDLPMIENEGSFLKMKREPRLFTFTTNKKDVDIKMEFGVPFITIPIKRTIAGLKNFANNAFQGNLPQPANVNPMSIIFIALFSLGMTTTAFSIWATNRRQYLLGTAPYIFRSIDPESDSEIPELQNLWKLLQSIDRTLSRFNIDTSACAQKTVCEFVEKSMKEIETNGDDASALNIILEGLTRSDWAMRFINGSAIGDAVRIAREKKNCTTYFTACKVDFRFLKESLNKFL